MISKLKYSALFLKYRFVSINDPPGMYNYVLIRNIKRQFVMAVCVLSIMGLSWLVYERNSETINIGKDCVCQFHFNQNPKTPLSGRVAWKNDWNGVVGLKHAFVSSQGFFTNETAQVALTIA